MRRSLADTLAMREVLPTDRPFPLGTDAAACRQCHALAAAVDTAGAAADFDVAVGRQAAHQWLHQLVERGMRSAAAEQAWLRTAHWSEEDGRPVLADRAGTTDASLAFFVAHCYRFGSFTLATLGGDDSTEQRLRLYDDRGRVLSLGGVSAGYVGTGPSGTVWLLRMAGFPDSDERGSLTHLERLVYTLDHFFLLRVA